MMWRLIIALACCTSAASAGERSAPLPAVHAKALLSQFIMPGKVFAVGDNRYAVQSLDVRERAQVFTVTIKIQPLAKVP